MRRGSAPGRGDGAGGGGGLPTTESRPAAARALDEIARRGDRWMAGFVAFHSLLALALAPVYGTWRTTLVVTTAAAGLFAWCAWRAPGRRVTRVVAGCALQAFCALHIFQMRGLAEMHFFYFTSTTALIIYQDWKAMWPGVLGIIIQHTLFSYWHNTGVHPGGHPFFEPAHVDAVKLGFHYGLAFAQAGIASYWAEVLRRRTLAAVAQTAALEAREAEFRAMAENIPQLAWMADAAGAVYWYNRRWYDYTGATPEAMRGAGWQTAHHPSHVARVTARFRACVADGTPWEDTFPLRRADGAWRWFLSRAEPIRDAAGAVVRWFGTNTDVTDERERAERLRASEERYALAAKATSNVIWDWDLATDTLTWDEGVHEVFRYAPGEVSATTGWREAAIHPDDRPRVVEGLRGLVEHARADGVDGAHEWEAGYRFRRGDGTYAEIRDRGYVARDAHGAVVRMIGAMEDVSAERAAQAEAQRLLAEAERARVEAELARAAAERANRTKSEFLATMSHELRTPLNAIAGHVQLVQLGVHGAVSDAQQDALGRVVRAQRHLLHIITDLLNFAKLEEGTLAYLFEPVLLADVLRDVAPLVQQQMDEKRHTLGIAIEEPPPRGDGPGPVWADREKLAQILLNLLTNAIKFTPPGGRIGVSARAIEDGDRVALVVADTGIGIPAEKVERIFEPFVQVDPTLTRQHGGVGLGLSISRDLARGMGGDLTVTSIPGVGSTFTVLLDPAPAVAATAAVARRR